MKFKFEGHGMDRTLGLNVSEAGKGGVRGLPEHVNKNSVLAASHEKHL